MKNISIITYTGLFCIILGIVKLINVHLIKETLPIIARILYDFGGKRCYPEHYIINTKYLILGCIILIIFGICLILHDTLINKTTK